MIEEIVPVTPAEPQDLSALMESISQLGESIQSINERVAGFEEKFTPVTPDPVVDPDNDPLNQAPANWRALREEFETKAEEKAKAIIEARDNAAKAEEQAAKAQIDSLNKTFDDMADEAMKLGFLPEIKDANDNNDPGKEARRELFGYAAKLGSTNLVDVAENLSNLHELGKHFDPRVGKIIQSEYRAEGANVPVGSSASRSGGSGNKIDAMTMKRASLDTLARMAMNQ